MSTETKTGDSGVKRRQFLKVLGGGTAVAASVGCGSERVEKLIPYLVSPDQTVPGVSTYYATTCRECPAGCGVIAETRDGRTIKLEGNPENPVNRGALCARGQAALQGLYNPDRYRSPMIRKDGKLTPATWDEALQLFTQKLGELRSKGQASAAVFINQHESGSFPGFLDQWLANYGIPAHISYDAEADVTAIAAHKAAYGVAWPRFDFSATKLVVSFNADFMEGWGAGVPQEMDWSEARAKLADAPRLVYIGARRSLTGLNADQWIDCKPGGELAIARALAGQATVEEAAKASGVSAEKLTQLVNEFRATPQSLVLASGNNVNATQLLSVVTELNKSKGAVGTSIRPDQAFPGFEGIAPPSALRAVVERMTAGTVSMLFVRNVNPAYTMGKSVGFGAAMAKVPFKVSFSSIMDETSELCDLILPDHYSLEQWGDAEPVAGTLSLQQPTMDPVFDTKATSDVLILAAQKDVANAAKYTFPDYRTWLINRFPGGSAALTAALPKGIAAGTPFPRTAPGNLPAPLAGTPIEQTPGDMYLIVYKHPVLGDGRGANKPWLQELPDPVTKICWQTVAEIHPLTAKKMGLENGDLVKITTNAGSLTLPVYCYLGIRQDAVAIATGRGQVNAGRYAKAGENALQLLPLAEDASGAMSYIATKASVSKAGGRVDLVTTEGSARQHQRNIARAVDADKIGHDDHHGHHEFPGDASHEFLPGLRAPVANDAQGLLGDSTSKQKGQYHPEHWGNQAKRRWAMTIDLARCTGCSACVTACYAENNIPTVGADWQAPQVLPDRTGFGANILRSREMSWLRLERYYEGGEDGVSDFETRFIPMLCQHCGNAPCEPVCPVYATYHAPDGLNVQVYNRCVGTRYCSNNCPYKVRYFNWFGYGEPKRAQYAFPEPLNWQLNPDVIVRGKGVMEKCTFCVQRIREAENRAKLEDRPLHPDEFTVACAQACPSRAITFGDAADENWSVTKILKDQRAYHVFEELNTFTAVVYLKKVNHPAPGSTGAADADAHGAQAHSEGQPHG
jgi:anaerobic selenocysteine-containing dehydrogenase/Fe-S-cluster-containing dehydrogenase component